MTVATGDPHPGRPAHVYMYRIRYSTDFQYRSSSLIRFSNAIFFMTGKSELNSETGFVISVEFWV